MPLEHFCQIGFIKIGLLQQLFDARLVLGPAHAGGNGNNVFSAKDFSRNPFVIHTFCLTHGFLGQSAGGKKLDGKPTEQKMFTFNLPALCLQVCVDGGNAPCLW